jgi:hypothetical protein
MASELRVNTLKDASGNNSIATSFVAGGSAKMWAFIEGDGTPTLSDSLNVSSINDQETGVTTTNFTSNMTNADYSANGTPRDNDEIMVIQELVSSAPRSTSAVALKTHNLSGSRDSNSRSYTVNGDLA